MESKFLKLFVTLTAALTVHSGLNAESLTINVLPSVQSVTVGSTVTSALQIEGLGDHEAPSLGIFDLILTFDPATLSFDSASFGDPLLCDQLDPTGLGNTFNFDNPGFGTVELFDLSLDDDTDLNSLQAPAFILASVTFEAVGSGISALDLGLNSLGDADGSSLTAVVVNGEVNVAPETAVPEPASLMLCGSAVLLGAVLRHRGLRTRNLR
jgi:hypothetical protein